MINKGYNDLTKEELEEIKKCNYVAIDTETTGLNFMCDKLCTIQLHNDNVSFFVKIKSGVSYVNIEELLFESDCVKIFHNAMFDVSFLMTKFEHTEMKKIICTKISSKLIHGLEHDNTLKGLVKNYLDVEFDKQYRISDWCSDDLTNEQINYAMSDVKYLYPLWSLQKIELIEKNLYDLAQRCFDFIPCYIKLKSAKIDNIFEY